METEKIVRQFFDAGPTVHVVPFGNGLINDTFKVEFVQNGVRNTRLLQKLNTQVFSNPEAVMENIRCIADHLSAKDYPMHILTPLSVGSGALLHCDTMGNYWRAFPFFENTISFDKVDTPEQAREAARAFGAFTKSLTDMDVSALDTTIKDFHNGGQRMRMLREVLKKSPEHLRRNARSEVQEILQHQGVFKRIAGLKCPVRAVHHDTKINNVLFEKETLRACCVIDLDTVMPGIILSDFGDMMRTFTCPADEDEKDLDKIAFREPVFEALTDGFLSEMGNRLEAVERNHLFEGGLWVTLMQAIRFLTDYLSGDRYYKTEYPEHNLIRTRNQLALFHVMRQSLL